MADWPDGWREALIAEMGVPQSKFLMRVLLAWQQSTPIEPYTNNPLGMPYTPGVVPQLLGSGYALFHDMPRFRYLFVRFLNGGNGADLKSALLTAEDLGPAYRAIHALDWPGNRTETDYPAKVLDLMTAPVREKLQSTDPADRKSAGTIGYSPVGEATSASLGNALRDASSTVLNAADAFRRRGMR